MATYSRLTRVSAPLSEVWDFHSRVSGLKALTPGWMNLHVEAVTGPDGDRDPEILETGSEIQMSMRPFGVGPRQRWTSVITERESGEERAMFRDEMRGGPFAKWVHTHRFIADGEEAIIDDQVEYELPGGGLGRTASPLAVVGFEPMFRARHRKTKELLE
ncbi:MULTISPECIES: SRPBCC family protein [Halobellus]|uniref:SRPBCC family protein n=1 Tax=Halobellus TaxID=1073986 RepID=UPI00210CBE3A|nr:MULTISPECIES: SRPBCC family protein [Halobellus]MDQ2053999.1 SRPBCC family protein [Halobellus sp. H-GB7]